MYTLKKELTKLSKNSKNTTFIQEFQDYIQIYKVNFFKEDVAKLTHSEKEHMLDKILFIENLSPNIW